MSAGSADDARRSDRPQEAGREGPIVTLDGPAGSGKSSTAKAVAHALGFRHLDSGALYRALTFALIDAGVPHERWPGLGPEDFRALDVRAIPTDEGFEVQVCGKAVDKELRTPEVTQRVPLLAGLSAARSSLIGLQREAGARGRLVTDGRDMGTEVFPDAEVKIFLVADLDERARRRLRETGTPEPTPDELQAQRAQLAERDRQDSERAHSPLREPVDARRIDTTGLAFEEQVQAVVDLVRRLTGS